MSVLSDGVDGYKDHYDGSTCSGTPGSAQYYVYVPNQTAANDACTAAVPGSTAMDLGYYFTGLDLNTFFWCEPKDL